MMCSSATALHALNQARVVAGDTIAVFGVGGLGVSAIQLARLRSVRSVYAVDIHPRKLDLARVLGAIPVDARAGDPVAAIRQLTDGRGVDAALELIGLPLTMEQAIRSLAIHGRAALAGLTDRQIAFSPYHDLLNREATVIGVSDHLATELQQLISFVERGQLDLSAVVTQTVPLEAAAINRVLDDLEAFGGRLVAPGRQVSAMPSYFAQERSGPGAVKLSASAPSTASCPSWSTRGRPTWSPSSGAMAAGQAAGSARRSRIVGQVRDKAWAGAA